MGIEASGYNPWFYKELEGNFKDFSLILDVEGSDAFYNSLFFEAGISETFFSPLNWIIY